MGTCRYCGTKAGFLRRQHPQCRDLHAEGVRKMVQLAAQAAGTASFNEATLRQTPRAIAADWARGGQHAMSEGIVTQEEQQLLHFRDRLISRDDRLVSEAASNLDQAASDRLMVEAQTAAVATQDGEARLQDLETPSARPGFHRIADTSL